MSFRTYRETRPWAKAIKEAVLKKRMPPWFAEQGHFANDPTLTQSEVNTFVSWANGGAPEGDARHKPAPVAFHDGWNITPNLIVEMPKEFHVPAAGIFRRPLLHVATGVAVGCGLLAMVAFARSGSGVAIARQAALLLAYGIAVMGVCLLACVGPALRALRLDPVEALRDDA